MAFRGPGIEPWWFGGGFDGNVTIAAPTTLTQDRYYKNLTVSAALNTGGFRIFASEKITVTMAGIVRNNGAAASGMTGGAGGAAGTLGGGSAGGNGVNRGGGAGNKGWTFLLGPDGLTIQLGNDGTPGV